MHTIGALVLTASLIGPAAPPASAVQESRTESAKPSLLIPSIVFVGAATADWITTYQADRRGARESNPLYAWADGRSALQATVGAASDVVGLWAWNRFVGRNHRRIATIGLYAMSALRIWYAVKNNQSCRPTACR